ncbi:hypothetical protein ACLB2K_031941 [Fragaria x ananassa]
MHTNITGGVSQESSIENMDDHLENDDSMLARERDLKFEVDNVEVVHSYVDEKSFDRGHECREELKHEQAISHSLDADFKDQIPESPVKSYPVPVGFDHDNTIETKLDFQERTQSTYEGSNHYQETTNQGTGDSDMVRFPHAGRVRNISSEKLLDDIITSSIHGTEKEATDLQTGQSLSSPKSHWLDNESNKDDSPDEIRLRGVTQSDLQFHGRSASRSISPITRRQMPISPEGSPLPLHSLHDHKQISSQQGVFYDHLSPVRQTSASTHGIRQEPPEDCFVVKHLSASLKSHHSPPKYRKRNRSESQSPIQRRHSPTRHRGSPTRHRVSPTRRRVSPTRHRVSPTRRRVSLLGLEMLMPTREIIVIDIDQGFSFLTSERDLERKFSRYGRVQDVRIVRDKRSGDSRGFGFLTLESDEHTDAAIRALDETEWNGRIILVEKSKS